MMLAKIISFSLRNKFTVLFFTLIIVLVGIYSISRIHIGAVPDVTNNQVQVITTSRNLATEDIEQFITYPLELEMANLPGVTEIRSVSKFGLSVVTIVFEDNMGTYLPRQLIAEKLQAAKEKIPEGYGSPQMGPITTGLGEIYQYVLDLEPGYENAYTPTELRTIQDWIVKRQLSGIPGVVEVNTWGGYLKQYEVAIKSEKLNAMNITTSEVFRALENNNSTAGGGYIAKRDMAYFIRGEGLIKNLKEIEQIVVKTNDGLPVYIRDVAEVGHGNALRFGAITGNGEGEKVLGQVMMIKNGNSNQVIKDVKKRVKEISGSLPEGVVINPFLERSELIARTTMTITENLILGCLIVVLVVFLLLGNIRSGLVVASIIPITLLFAMSLMLLTDVDANLMSLGAIDFGIIIDGSVIIVEFVAFRISSELVKIKALKGKDRKKAIDDITYHSATKMMNSAIFGQLIILIVFIPVLTLSGVEGKMFRPMAMTFSFALIGAMILGLTYVPVMSSLMIRPRKQEKKNISEKIVDWIYGAYLPVLKFAMKFKKSVIGIAVGLVIFAGLVFQGLGAEFVPTLDEGDFVIQPVLKTGLSLEKTIQTTTRIERILLDSFPEVEQVVSRIGAAEIPTDPMSMEESDIIIKLKPKRQWTSAASKDELADMMKSALSVIPEMDIEFTQPIEMRFNELITGVRADIAVKIFGEDLSILSNKAREIERLISNVQGASDVTVEKVEGLPQILVRYNRNKIGRYGLSIDEVNRNIVMNFAGAKAGEIFEGERRFDLVVRSEKASRENLENLSQLYMDTPNGMKVPLSELAQIEYLEGPAKISRDETKRRIVVGINVRNRDLQSVVDDVEQIIAEKIELPAGYYVAYGGQFENLQQARSRLKFAVPIALALIFILLYFAFDSVTEALFIYSAIPLAAVGGVMLLWIRDLPFSISAGVGFIALFGIAVLNGIVLIEHFNELKSKGMKDLDQIILRGTKERLRPVLLTAGAAALGFLPMALSTNAGAEVQRPLATVVIGGLVTSTMLTMVVLPIIYLLFKKDGKSGKKGRPIQVIVALIASVALSGSVNAQEHTDMALEHILRLAAENNAGLKAAGFRWEEQEAMTGNAFDFDKTELYYHYDENNLALNEQALNVFGIQQEFLFPTVYFADHKVRKMNSAMEMNLYQKRRIELLKEVSLAYYSLQYNLEKANIYKRLDSFYTTFSYAAKRRFETGESNYLERITAKAKQRQLKTRYAQSLEDVAAAKSRLYRLVQAEDSLLLGRVAYAKYPIHEVLLDSNPGILYYKNRTSYFKARKRLETQNLLPDLKLSYFSGTNEGLDNWLQGYQIGLKFPILFSGNSSRIKASKLAWKMAEQDYLDYQFALSNKKNTLRIELKKFQEMLDYYEEEGKLLSSEIFNTANASFENGEINFFQYLQSVENALEILLEYMGTLDRYNQAAIHLKYLTL